MPAALGCVEATQGFPSPDRDCLSVADFGVSLEVGAFAAGVSLTCLPCDARKRVENTLEPIRDVLTALFFACTGFVVNPVFLWDNAMNILVAFLFICTAKMLVMVLLVSLEFQGHQGD